jgi:alpha-tubulin suppressor-like RCC1 family protein
MPTYRHLLFLSAALLTVPACASDPDDIPSLSDETQEVINERNWSVAAGFQHSCAVDSGVVTCWGRNNYGQLGNGTTVDSRSPVTVSGISTAVAVAAGKYHTCAVLASGSARCWGLNTSGQIGNGTTTNRTTPGTVSGLSGVTSIAAGDAHTCASLSTGQVRCWGSNTYGQVGNGTATTTFLTPTTVGTRTSAGTLVALANVTEVETGAQFACARKTDGTVGCWGRNQYGQLGDGTTSNRTSPVGVSGLASVGDLAAGDFHACAVMSTGRARCWGNNLMGQLGDGTQSGRTTPVEVRRAISKTTSYPIVGVTAISAGQWHTCMRSSTALWCTGNNDFGQLGRDTTGYLELLAVAANPSLVISEVAAGSEHTCVRRPGGGVVCLGRDSYGQVGDSGRCPTNPTATITSVAFPGGHVLEKADNRGPIYYTDGNALDITLETTACAQVSEVGFKWGPILPDDPIEPSDGNGFEILSTTDRTDGVRVIRLRIDFQNAGNGTTYPVTIELESPSGNVATDSFTLVEALKVTVAGSTEATADNGTVTLGRDELTNEVLQAMYKKFGDYNYWTKNGVNLYDFDGRNLVLDISPGGIYFRGTVKADLGLGDCNPSGTAWGTFKIELDGDRLVTNWVEEVDISVAWPPFCLTSYVPHLIIAGMIAEGVKDDTVAEKISKRIAELTDYCPSILGGCANVIKSIDHLDDQVRVTLLPNFDAVTFRQRYLSSQLDEVSIGDPMRRGVALPPNDGVILVTGGIATGCGTQACPEVNHVFGTSGLFNWNWEPLVDAPADDSWGAHPPILDPWRCTNGSCVTLDGRQVLWDRQQGMRRDLANILMPNRNVGATVARIIHADGTASPLKHTGDYVCGLDAAGGDAARLVVGRNDIPTGPLDGEYGNGDALVTMVLTGADIAFGSNCAE